MVSLPEKITIRKCFGGKEKEYRTKKGNFKKKKARVLGIICRKNGVCVGRCMCPRNHGGKKGNL